MRDFQDAVTALHAELGAGRIILRLEQPGRFYPVVAEALAPGIRSVASGPEPDFSQAATFLFVTQQLRPLVQDEVLGHPLSPPADIVGHYGVTAQLLVPVVRGSRFVGVVGIHMGEGARTWTDEELARADAFARWVAWELEVEDLRERIGVSRTTLRRYVGEEPYFPIVAESVGEGVNALRGGAGPDLRKARTMQYLLEHRSTLVQEDLLATDTPPPPELIAQYGARSQVLGCISEGETLVAFVSAHHAEPRVFTPNEIKLVEDACARIAPTLAPRAWGGR